MMLPTTVVAQGTSPALTFTFHNPTTGAVADPSTPAVSVVDQAGVASAGWTVTVNAGTSVVVDGPATLDLGVYRVSVSGTVAGAQQTHRAEVEVKGSRYVNLHRAQAEHPVLAHTSWPGLLAALATMEQEVDEFVGFSFVTRRHRMVVDGSGRPDLVVPVYFPAAVVAADVLDADLVTWVPVDAADIAKMGVSDDGALIWRGGSWPSGTLNVAVTFDHGWFTPPAALEPAFRQHLAHIVTRDARQAPLEQSVDGGDGFIDTTTGIPLTIQGYYDPYRKRLAR